MKDKKNVRKNQSVVLNSRIANTGISIIIEVIILTISFIIILGGYFLYNAEASDLYPTQQLTSSFIRFTSQQVITISCALLIKVQQKINIIQTQRFRVLMKMDKLWISFWIIMILIMKIQQKFYEFILESNRIYDYDEAIQFSLYSEDYCKLYLLDSFLLVMKNLILILNMGHLIQLIITENFQVQVFKGVFSHVATLFKQQFIYQIEHKDFQVKLDVVLEQLNIKEFNKAIFQNFLGNIMIVLNDVMGDDVNVIFSYQLAAAIFENLLNLMNNEASGIKLNLYFFWLIYCFTLAQYSSVIFGLSEYEGIVQ